MSSLTSSSLKSPNSIVDPLADLRLSANESENPLPPRTVRSGISRGPSWSKPELFAEPFSSATFNSNESIAVDHWNDIPSSKRQEHTLPRLSISPHEPNEYEPYLSATEVVGNQNSSSPICMPSASKSSSTSSSSLRRARRTSSTEALKSGNENEGDNVNNFSPSGYYSHLNGMEHSASVTPRGKGSGFTEAKLASSSIVQDNESSTPTALTTGEAFANSTFMLTRGKGKSTEKQSDEDIPLVELIRRACIAGDLETLQHHYKRGEQAHKSSFELSNSTSPHTALTPLHFASRGGHLDVVIWLIESAGSIKELEDNEGETSLHKAAYRGHLEVCRYLIESGTDLGAKPTTVEPSDKDGWTPLHNAASRGYLDIVKLLIVNGASVDKRSKHGYSALMNAASKGHLPIVHYLLTKQHADPFLRNKWGETAYDLSAAVFEIEICTILSKFECLAWSASTTSVTPNEAVASSSAAISSNLATSREEYSPLLMHSTIPITLNENQRLGRRTLTKWVGGGRGGDESRFSRNLWSSKYLSRHDGVAPFTMPFSIAHELSEYPTSYNAANTHQAKFEIPLQKEEICLPVKGSEKFLKMPERSMIKLREISDKLAKQSAGGEGGLQTTSQQTSVKRTLPGNENDAKEPVYFWLSDWTIDLTNSSASAFDGWSYANSFDAEPDQWSSEMPQALLRVLQGGSGSTGPSSTGGSSSDKPKKWVRRRRWVRVMRRRLDVKDWGYANVKRDPSTELTITDGEDPQELQMEMGTPPGIYDMNKEKIDLDDDLGFQQDYLARARFLSGTSHRSLMPTEVSDRASIQSGKTLGGISFTSSGSKVDRVELRRARARLDRATEELKIGMRFDEDLERREEAGLLLDKYLQQLSQIRAELADKDEESDIGEDGDPDNRENDIGVTDGDSRSSIRTTSSLGRRPVTSRSNSSTSFSSAFANPISTNATAVDDDSSFRLPDLTPQLSQAPEFRVPTQETSQISPVPPTPLCTTNRSTATWEPDEATSECRQCSKKFSFFSRKHHCRRCGKVFCANCSSNLDRIDRNDIVLEPGAGEEEMWMHALATSKHRTCDTCHTALSIPVRSGSVSSSTAAAFFNTPTATDTGTRKDRVKDSMRGGSVTPSETGASDVSDLTDCPVCGIALASIGEGNEQEEHVQTCLDAGGGVIASNGRYLVFKLPPGPLVEEECKICFGEFEVGDSIGRLACLCYFHQSCISAWLSRGKSCPFHASREYM